MRTSSFVKRFLFLSLTLTLTACGAGGGDQSIELSSQSSNLKYTGASLNNLALCETEHCRMMKLGEATCNFNGQILLHGETVTAYLWDIDPDGGCASEQRVCNNGALSGGFIFSSCNNAQTSCRFNGQEIPDGGSVTAYLNSTGDTCESEVRTCTRGVLSGSHSYSTCTINAPMACLFNGQTIQHGETVVAYQNSSVDYGQSCSQEVRLCQNGNLLGSFQNGSCTVNQPASCQFNGQTFLHGSSITAYQTSSVPFGETCSSETRVCSNGGLSGNFSFATCEAQGPAGCLFNGRTLAHGETVLGFESSTVPFGEQCTSQARTCQNGSLSGSYTHSACTPDIPKTCSFNGQTLAHGEKIRAYLTSSVGYGNTCSSEERICEDGALSGSYSFASCQANQPSSCLFNGQTINHGQEVSAFQNSNVAFGETCVSEKRICENGNLSGSYNYALCEVGAPAACLFNGQTLPHGQSTVAFETSTVPFGQECRSESRTCTNGMLSGAFEFGSCQALSAPPEEEEPPTEEPPPPPASCLFNGQTIAHGGFVLAYQLSSVRCGDRCDSQKRVCTNGNLSGSYPYASCNPDDAPKSCQFQGRTLAHGERVIAYRTKTVGKGETCLFQKRTCLNGRMTGNDDYKEKSCTPVKRMSDPKLKDCDRKKTHGHNCKDKKHCKAR